MFLHVEWSRYFVSSIFNAVRFNAIKTRSNRTRAFILKYSVYMFRTTYNYDVSSKWPMKPYNWTILVEEITEYPRITSPRQLTSYECLIGKMRSVAFLQLLVVCVRETKKIFNELPNSLPALNMYCMALAVISVPTTGITLQTLAICRKTGGPGTSSNERICLLSTEATRSGCFCSLSLTIKEGTSDNGAIGGGAVVVEDLTGKKE